MSTINNIDSICQIGTGKFLWKENFLNFLNAILKDFEAADHQSSCGVLNENSKFGFSNLASQLCSCGKVRTFSSNSLVVVISGCSPAYLRIVYISRLFSSISLGSYGTTNYSSKNAVLFTGSAKPSTRANAE